jgi:hypothetical protein
VSWTCVAPPARPLGLWTFFDSTPHSRVGSCSPGTGGESSATHVCHTQIIYGSVYSAGMRRPPSLIPRDVLIEGKGPHAFEGRGIGGACGTIRANRGVFPLLCCTGISGGHASEMPSKARKAQGRMCHSCCGLRVGRPVVDCCNSCSLHVTGASATTRLNSHLGAGGFGGENPFRSPQG